MKELRETIIKSLLRHAEGHIEKHCANIEVYLTNPAGVGEHPDILEAIEKELAVIAEYEDQISIIRKYLSYCLCILLEIKIQVNNMIK